MTAHNKKRKFDELPNFKRAYCQINFDPWILKETQLSMYVIKSNIEFDIAMLEKRMGILFKPLQENEDMKLGLVNHGMYIF